MLTVKKETTTKDKLTIKNLVKGKNSRSSSTDTDSNGKKRTYTNVVIKGSSFEDDSLISFRIETKGKKKDDV